MFIKSFQLPEKAYAAYAYTPAQGESPAQLLTLTGHTSLRAAKRGMREAHAEVGNLSVVVTGWFLIEPDMREHGYVL